MSFQEALSQVVNRHEELAALMSDASSLNASEFTKMSKEYAELTPVVEVVNALRGAQAEMTECEQMLADPDCDAEMKELAEAEYHDLKKRVPELERDVQLMLLPKDKLMKRTLSLKFVQGQAEMKPRFLQLIFTACINVMQNAWAGNLNCWMSMKSVLAVSKRFQPTLQVKTYLPALNTSPAYIVCNVCPQRKAVDAFIHRLPRLPYCPKLKM